MAKGVKLYLTAKEVQTLKGILFNEAETLQGRIDYDDEEDGSYKKEYDLVCSIWNKLHK